MQARDAWRGIKAGIDEKLANLLGKGWTGKSFKEDLGPTLDKLQKAAVDLDDFCAATEPLWDALPPRPEDAKDAKPAEAILARVKEYEKRAPDVKKYVDQAAAKVASYRQTFEAAVKGAKVAPAVLTASKAAVDAVLDQFDLFAEKMWDAGTYVLNRRGTHMSTYAAQARRWIQAREEAIAEKKLAAEAAAEVAAEQEKLRQEKQARLQLMRQEQEERHERAIEHARIHVEGEYERFLPKLEEYVKQLQGVPLDFFDPAATRKKLEEYRAKGQSLDIRLLAKALPKKVERVPEVLKAAEIKKEIVDLRKRKMPKDFDVADFDKRLRDTGYYVEPLTALRKELIAVLVTAPARAPVKK